MKVDTPDLSSDSTGVVESSPGIEALIQEIHREFKDLTFSQNLIRDCDYNIVQNAIKIGKLLLDFKKRRRGNFEEIFRGGLLPFSRATAYRYMGLATRYPECKGLPEDPVLSQLIREHGAGDKLNKTKPVRLGEVLKTVKKGLRKLKEIPFENWDSQQLQKDISSLDEILNEFDDFKRRIDELRKR